jgi:DNA polymerase
VKLWLDCETYSATPITHGTYAYAADAEVMLLAWAANEGPVSTWDRTADPVMPARLRIALREADEVWAHNAAFDRAVLSSNFPELCPPIERWRCSMARALAHSLPGSLDKLCEILEVPQDKAKLKDGRALVHRFCKPLAKTSKTRRATRETHPEEWERFVAYCAQDVDAMRECCKRLPEWNYKGKELALWHLDQRVNDRGFAVDVELAEAAVKAIDIEQARLAGAAWAHTDGAVNAATQRDAMLEHILAEYGIALADLKGSTVERRLDDPDIPEGLKELLRIRLQASTTSTSKYKALVKAQTGGRLRGTLQFDGAGRTGRWCIAEGSLVTTLGFDGFVRETPIELVRDDDLVWDGDDWVAHDGVVFSGVKDVIQHDGILATPEHNVYTATSVRTTLARAKEQGTPLWPGNAPTESTN